MLEFHGIPVLEDEATKENIHRVAQLVDLENPLQVEDISINQRLPSREGTIPPIIVKFSRRNERQIYNATRELSTKTAQDLGFPHNNKLHTNGSLTPKLRQLL